MLWPAEYKARKGLLGRNMLIGQPLGSKASNIFCLEQLFCSRNRTGHPDDMAPAMAERQPGSAEPRHPYHFTSSQLLGTLRAVAALLDVRGPFPISAARSKLHFLGFTPSLFFFFFFWLALKKSRELFSGSRDEASLFFPVPLSGNALIQLCSA